MTVLRVFRLKCGSESESTNSWLHCRNASSSLSTAPLAHLFQCSMRMTRRHNNSLIIENRDAYTKICKTLDIPSVIINTTSATSHSSYLERNRVGTFDCCPPSHRPHGCAMFTLSRQYRRIDTTASVSHFFDRRGWKPFLLISATTPGTRRQARDSGS